MRNGRTWLLGIGLVVAGLCLTWSARDAGAPYAPSPSPAHLDAHARAAAVTAPVPNRTPEVAAAGAMPADASDGDDPLAACAQAETDAIAVHVETLAGEDDARTQLVRALVLATAGDNGASRRALARAAELAPADPLVARVVHGQCADGCDRAASAARLVAIDPGNAWSWLAVAEEALRRGDDAGAEQALANAAHAPRIDDHYGEVALETAAVLQQAPWPDACRASASALGQRLGLGRPATQADDVAMRASALSGWVLPAGMELARGCNARSLARVPGRKAACVAALARMADSDTLHVRMLALSLLAKATASDRDGVRWREARARLASLLAQQRGLPPDVAAIVRGWEIGEIPALQARLRAPHRRPAPSR